MVDSKKTKENELGNCKERVHQTVSVRREKQKVYERRSKKERANRLVEKNVSDVVEKGEVDASDKGLQVSDVQVSNEERQEVSKKQVEGEVGVREKDGEVDNEKGEVAIEKQNEGEVVEKQNEGDAIENQNEHIIDNQNEGKVRDEEDGETDEQDGDETDEQDSDKSDEEDGNESDQEEEENTQDDGRDGNNVGAAKNTGDDKDVGEVRIEVKRDFSKSKLYRVFNNHVASLLLKDIPEDRGPLSCKQHSKKFEEWIWRDEHRTVIKLVKDSPLYCLTKCFYPTANRVLISAFIERWHAETNSFHGSFGEITITLDDVNQILGLPIQGSGMCRIYGSSIEGEDEDWDVFTERVLGIPQEDVREEFVLCKSKNCVRLEFLRKKLAGKAPDTFSAEQVAKGYLLYLLGCTLFQDKTGDKVQLKYLYYLEDFNKINKWAWGAACLAYLYRELGKASRSGTKSISGYLTLLEAWIYEHFPRFRPNKKLKLKAGMTRAALWTPRSHYPAQDAGQQLHYMRIQLDGLRKSDVVWTPYRGLNDSPPDVVWFNGILMAHDITEPYQPDRVVRQFGHIQDVPKNPMAPSRAKGNGKKAMSNAPRFDGRTDEFDKWDNHVINPANRGGRATKNSECTKEYDNWVKDNCICRLDFSVKDPLAHEFLGFLSLSSKSIFFGLTPVFANLRTISFSSLVSLPRIEWPYSYLYNS